MSNEEPSKQVLKREPTKDEPLFDAFHDSERVAEITGPKSARYMAHQIAMELLAHDSDKHIKDLETKGPEYFDNFAKYVTAGMEMLAHDMTLMGTAIERARVISLLAAKPKDTDSLN